MTRVVAGLLLLALTAAGCSAKESSEPATRSADRSAELSQEQMIAEEPGDSSLALKAESVSSEAAMPTCAEIDRALGSVVAGLALAKAPAEASLAQAGLDESEARPGRANQEPTDVECLWRVAAADGSRPDDLPDDAGLTVSVTRSAEPFRRADAGEMGLLVEVPEVEKAGGFVVAVDDDLGAPLSDAGPEVVIGATSVLVSGFGGADENALLGVTMRQAVFGALAVHRLLGS